MIKQEGIVKRCDLSLRVKYFGMQTEIYQIGNFQFAIFCENYKGDFIKINEEFNHSIKPVGTSILLVKERPKQYIKKIKNISFDNVVDGFKATCVTLKDLNDFIKLRFYNVEIISVSVPASGVDFEILVEVSEETPQETIENLHSALMEFDLGTDKISIKKSNKNPSKKQTNNFDVMLLSSYEHLPFTIDEGVFWLDNAERIYSGGFNKTELMFFRPNTTKCFF